MQSQRCSLAGLEHINCFVVGVDTHEKKTRGQLLEAENGPQMIAKKKVGAFLQGTAFF